MVTFKMSHIITEKVSFSRASEKIYYGKRIEVQRNGLLAQRSERVLTNSKVQKSAEQSVSKGDLLTYAYCCIMVCRYWASAFALHSFEQKPSTSLANTPTYVSPITYFQYDLIMDAVYRKSHFDKMAFLLVAFLLIYCIAVHYIRNYQTDELILEQQLAMVVGSWRTLASVYPQFNVSFSSANVLSVFVNIFRKKMALSARVEHLSALEEAQSQSGSKFGGAQKFKTHASVVLLSMTLEMVNIVIFVILSVYFLHSNF